jgi:hypothetical protein
MISFLILEANLKRDRSRALANLKILTGRTYLGLVELSSL